MSGELTDGSAVKREQGRRANQLRALASEQAVLHRADGSATFSHGDTRCTASVYGPGQPAAARREVPDRAAVEVVYKPADTVAGPPHKEIEEQLHRIAEAALVLERYPGCLLCITVQVLRDEGSVLACAINAMSLALVDAGLQLRALIVASSCVVVTSKHGAAEGSAAGAAAGAGASARADCSDGDGGDSDDVSSILLDPSAEEERDAVAHMTAALQHRAGTTEGIVSCHSSGALQPPHLLACLRACSRSAASVASFMRLAVEARLRQENPGLAQPPAPPQKQTPQTPQTPQSTDADATFIDAEA